MFKTLTKNIFSNYVGIAGSILIAFLLSPFLVHTLGDTKYGVWSVVSALTGYMALLDLGISSAIAKYVAKHKALNDYKSLNTVLASGLVIMLAVGSLLVIASPLIADLMVSFFDFEGELGENVHLLILIASVDIAIFVTTGILVGSMYGFQRHEIINGVNLSITLLNACFFYVVLRNGYDLVAMGVVNLVGNVIAAVIFIIALRKIEPKASLDIRNAEKPVVRTIFTYSKYTFLSMLAMQLVYYSDAFVIGFFMSAAAITYYTIPWSLSEYTNKLIHAIAETFVPVFSEQEATQGNKAIYDTYISGTKFMLMISNLLCIGMLVMGDYFVGLWMGEKYAVACSAVLSIMFFTQLIKGPQLLSYSILLGTANHRRFSQYNFAFSVLNLILSIIFIQRYGLIGVAGATAFTQIVFYGIITPVLTSRVIGSSLLSYFKETYLRALPASVILLATLYWLARVDPPDSYLLLLSQALLAAAIYTVVCYWTLLNSPERQFLIEKVSAVTGRLSAARAG
ncbi:hypothetical protein AB833_02085 [Chromatiales bacterium (ex Bugula neritina AB1)]|nr:hypothetical protein AB833_02085 [Chromatiales bacterium (ex Bugula neritina AB1)]